MGESINGMERRRRAVAEEISGLGDLRPGSVTAIHKKCGKAGCCCTGAEHPGHGPHWRLTYKSGGRSLSESLTGPAIAKAEREIAEFRRFQELSREFVDLSARICRARPVESGRHEEKKRRKPSSKK
jgi:hypothetical protein